MTYIKGGCCSKRKGKARAKHVKELMKHNVIIYDDTLTPIGS